MSIWTNSNVALLKFLWSKGYSAAEIAKRITGSSRNSVLGKIHRLDLNNRNQNYSRRGPRKFRKGVIGFDYNDA